ncbi:hypothetical protein SADUNF_Sadunf15G0037300 [Salix dunnii]|uniref:Uncharacterized protein n=1 Tax=Salix dunnii TaxID=1413687 RepID=A0A835JDC0_9ROSI|nr:hypothetical protein SADUNF_Sadunf15G0037300 [Salix dunnii]
MTRPGNGLAVKRNAKKNIKKPDICTADELHYVAVSISEWKLALWRYCLPSPKDLMHGPLNFEELVSVHWQVTMGKISSVERERAEIVSKPIKSRSSCQELLCTYLKDLSGYFDEGYSKNVFFKMETFYPVQFSFVSSLDLMLWKLLILLLELTTAFQEGGLQNCSGSFLYKDRLGKNNVPVLAIAGDQDLIRPPEAVHGLSTNLMYTGMVYSFPALSS